MILERQTLHVLDGPNRIAMVETKTIDAGVPVVSPAAITRYQFANHLGSAALELDDTAAIISYEEYFPYGGTSLQTVSGAVEVSLKRYRYQAKERDEETGLDYFGARHYAAWLGRWVSADPAGHVDGLNLYQFVRGNPLIFTDPGGTQSEPTYYDDRSKLSELERQQVDQLYRASVKQMQEMTPNGKALDYTVKVSDEDGKHTIQIDYEVMYPARPSENTTPVDGRMPMNLPGFVFERQSITITTDAPAAAEDPPASPQDETPSSSGSAESATAPSEHESPSFLDYLKKVKKYYEIAEDIKTISEPVLEYIVERIAKFGEWLKEISEKPFVKKVLGYLEPVLKYAGKVLTALVSIFEGIETGSGRPVAVGAGEIVGTIAAEVLVAAVTLVVAVALAVGGASAGEAALAMLAVAAFDLAVTWLLSTVGGWLGGKLYDLAEAVGGWLGGELFDLGKGVGEVWDKAVKGITDWQNWNPGLAH